MSYASKTFVFNKDVAPVEMLPGIVRKTLSYSDSMMVCEVRLQKGAVLEELTLEELRGFSELFEADIYNEIDLVTCVEKRISQGGTSTASVKEQIAYVKKTLRL